MPADEVGSTVLRNWETRAGIRDTSFTKLVGQMLDYRMAYLARCGTDVDNEKAKEASGFPCSRNNRGAAAPTRTRIGIRRVTPAGDGFLSLQPGATWMSFDVLMSDADFPLHGESCPASLWISLPITLRFGGALQAFRLFVDRRTGADYMQLHHGRPGSFPICTDIRQGPRVLIRALYCAPSCWDDIRGPEWRESNPLRASPSDARNPCSS